MRSPLSWIASLKSTSAYRATRVMALLVPLSLVAADCHTTEDEARVITKPAPARQTNPLIHGKNDLSTMKLTDQYIHVVKSETQRDASKIFHLISVPDGANDLVESVEVIVWLAGPPAESGQFEDNNPGIQYRLTSPQGTTTTFRPYGNTLRADSVMNVLRFNALFDGENPAGIWKLEFWDPNDDGTEEARYINSVLRVNEGQLSTLSGGAALTYEGFGDNLDWMTERATNSVIDPSRHLVNTFNVPEVGFTDTVTMEFSIVSPTSGFDPANVRVMLIAPSGNADCLFLSDDYAGTGEGTLGGAEGGQRSEILEAPETIEVGSNFSGLQVAVRTPNGDIDANQNSGTVTLTVVGNGLLSGETTAAISNGVASFEDLQYINGNAGEIIRLRARVNGAAISPDAFSAEIGVTSPSVEVQRYIMPMTDTMRGEAMNGLWRVVMWDVSEDGTTGLLGDLRLTVTGTGN